MQRDPMYLVFIALVSGERPVALPTLAGRAPTSGWMNQASPDWTSVVHLGPCTSLPPTGQPGHILVASAALDSHGVRCKTEVQGSFAFPPHSPGHSRSQSQPRRREGHCTPPLQRQELLQGQVRSSGTKATENQEIGNKNRQVRIVNK